MADNARQSVFLVDDEPDILLVVGRSLETVGVLVACFGSGTACLEKLRSERCDLLITDIKMPGMDGLELLTEAKRIAPSLPVLIMTGYGDVPMAVRALKSGAFDFVEKPLNRDSFLSVVKSALSLSSRVHRIEGKVLTKREREVLDLILCGKSNKEIAFLLRRSVRTIEDHYRQIKCKLGVDNRIDLVMQVAAVRPFGSPEHEQRHE